MFSSVSREGFSGGSLEASSRENTPLLSSPTTSSYGAASNILAAKAATSGDSGSFQGVAIEEVFSLSYSSSYGATSGALAAEAATSGDSGSLQGVAIEQSRRFANIGDIPVKTTSPNIFMGHNVTAVVAQKQSGEPSLCQISSYEKFFQYLDTQLGMTSPLQEHMTRQENHIDVELKLLDSSFKAHRENFQSIKDPRDPTFFEEQEAGYRLQLQKIKLRRGFLRQLYQLEAYYQQDVSAPSPGVLDAFRKSQEEKACFLQFLEQDYQRLTKMIDDFRLNEEPPLPFDKKCCFFWGGSLLSKEEVLQKRKDLETFIKKSIQLEINEINLQIESFPKILRASSIKELKGLEEMLKEGKILPEKKLEKIPS